MQPMAELQRPSQTPGAMQRSAVRAARAASAAGFDDHDLSDLPDNLPDPMMISPAPAPPPQQPRPQVGTPLRGGCSCALVPRNGFHFTAVAKQVSCALSVASLSLPSTSMRCCLCVFLFLISEPNACTPV
eukprot:scaffold4560_cov19-Tisochrysis_lutea.AAC.1